MLNWSSDSKFDVLSVFVSKKCNESGKNKVSERMALAIASLLLMGLVLVILSASEPQYLEDHHVMAMKCTV